MSSVGLVRRLVAGGAGVASVGALAATLSSHEKAIAFLPGILSLAAALFVHFPRVGPQLVARAVWWSNFALGVVITLIGSHDDRNHGFFMTTATAIALVAAGSRALAEATERDAFAPVAFRTTFLLLMMLTLADAQTLGVFTVATLLDGARYALATLVFTLGAVGLVVAFIGLYRLTLWGAILSVVTSLFVFVGVTFLGHMDMKSELLIFVRLLCAVEIVVGTPMIVAVLTRKRMPELPPAVRTWTARVVLGGLWALSGAVMLAGR
jgi:hypothetical protein